MLKIYEEDVINKNEKFRKWLLRDENHRFELSPAIKSDKRIDEILLEIANHHEKSIHSKSSLSDLRDTGTIILNDGTSDCIFWEIHYFDNDWNCVVDPLYYPNPKRLLYVCNLKECK